MAPAGILVCDAAVCGGQPVFRGTHVPFRTLMNYLRHERSLQQFLSDFPEVARVAGPSTQSMEELFAYPSHRLVVYGSLAPGKKNHHMMDGMQGTWRNAVLRGSLHKEGWGTAEGYPGFRWDGSGSSVPAQVFSSADLPQHWQRLDEFEGADYRRVLVPVEILPQQAKTGLSGDPTHEGDEVEVCYVYEVIKSD